jgi:hypothetical protein
MPSRSHVRQTRLSRFKVLRFLSILGLTALLVPSLASAQSSFTFTDLLFVERGIVGGSEYNGFHFCDEYFGHNGKLGGGLFLLKNFQTKPERVDIVAGLKVASGVNAGQTLSSGTFLSPELSFDGKTVVFAWSSGGGDKSGGSEKWVEKDRFHLFTVNLDGTNLVQVTTGNFDDMHPTWLPNGRIVFMSTRRGGYGRCHGRAVPTYAMYSVKADGSDLIRLSHHETNEFHPSIANDGRIAYMRWDYIDRDALAAHHIWFCNPDGSNPRSWGGNYSNPLDTMTGNGPWTDGRKDGKRPQSEFYPRAIPGSPTKYVAVAGPHHGEAFGTLIIRDFAKVDDNQMSQVTKITPDVGMPETAENGSLTYGPAWPLSETQFLTSYNNTIVLYDSASKKRTQYYQSANTALRPIYAQPVAARTKPPVIPEATYQGERWTATTPPATIQVQNVYTTDAYGKLPDGVKITSMRIVQVLPKTTPNANDPRLGYASQNVAKMVLGTVPVESDGSVFFEAPIGKLILFQLLDANGMAVQTMRSGTYLHPGENMVCTGCHEDKMVVATVGSTPLASKRPASKMEPELGKVEPLGFARLVQPILKNKCFTCHQGKANAPTDATYSALQNYAFWFAGDANGNLEAVHGGSRSKPGKIGALGSRMGKALLTATHKQALTDGKFTALDMRTIVQWLDTGSDELGAFDNQNAQRQGTLVWPSLDVDKNDPQGLKYDCEGRSPCVSAPRADGGVSPPDAPRADAPQGGSTGSSTTPTGSGGATGSAGATGTPGTVSSGGQTGSGSQTTPTGTGGIVNSSGGASNTGTRSTVSGGGQTGSSSVGTPSASAGSDTDTRSAVANGGQSGSNKSSTANGGGGNGCSMATNPSTPAAAWILFVMGIALLVRGRRR